MSIFRRTKGSSAEALGYNPKHDHSVVIAAGSTALHFRGAETEEDSQRLRDAIDVALDDLDLEAFTDSLDREL